MQLVLQVVSNVVSYAFISVGWQVMTRIEKVFLLFLVFNLLMVSNMFDMNLVV